jgi:MoxR-like ATPase
LKFHYGQHRFQLAPHSFFFFYFIEEKKMNALQKMSFLKVHASELCYPTYSPKLRSEFLKLPVNAREADGAHLLISGERGTGKTFLSTLAWGLR